MSHYLGYNAMDDFFPSMALKPNPQCADANCVEKQAEWQERERLEPKEVVVEVSEEEVTHEDNEWHIELVEEEAEPVAKGVKAPASATVELAEGLELAYDAPDVDEGVVESVETVESTVESTVDSTVESTGGGGEEQSLEELMAQMKSI